MGKSNRSSLFAKTVLKPSKKRPTQAPAAAAATTRPTPAAAPAAAPVARTNQHKVDKSKNKKNSKPETDKSKKQTVRPVFMLHTEAPIKHTFQNDIDKSNLRETTVDGVPYYQYLGGYMDQAQVEDRIKEAKQHLAPLLLQRLKGPVIAQLQGKVTFHHPHSNEWLSASFPNLTNKRHRLATIKDSLLSNFWADSILELVQSILDFAQRGSGWRLVMIDWVQVKVEADMVTGNKYIPTPGNMSRQSIINVKNTDDQCGRLSVLAAHWWPKVKTALQAKSGELYEFLKAPVFHQPEEEEETEGKIDRHSSLAHPSRFKEDPILYEALDNRWPVFTWPEKRGSWGASDWSRLRKLNPCYLFDVYYLNTAMNDGAPDITPWHIENTSLEESKGKTIIRIGLLGNRNLIEHDKEASAEEFCNHYVGLYKINSLLRDHHNRRYDCKSGSRNSYDICRICLTGIDTRYMESHMKQHEITGCSCRPQLPIPGKHTLSLLSKPCFYNGNDKDDGKDKLKLAVHLLKHYRCFMVSDFECTLVKTVLETEDPDAVKLKLKVDPKTGLVKASLNVDRTSEQMYKHEPNSFTLWWFMDTPEGIKTGHVTCVGSSARDTMDKFFEATNDIASMLKEFMETNKPLDKSKIPEPRHTCATRCHICSNHVHEGFEELNEYERDIINQYKEKVAPFKRQPTEKKRVYAEMTKEHGDLFVNAFAKLDWIKVADHDHHTGEYTGPAHNRCNREYTVATKPIQCFFHNGKGYDFHHIINYMPQVSNVNIIPLNKEQFLSVQVDKVLYKDSLQFFQAPLEKVVEVITHSDGELDINKVRNSMPRFVEWVKALMAARGIPCNKKNRDRAIQLLARKGVYPYNFLKTHADFKHEGMWPREALDEDSLNELINARHKLDTLQNSTADTAAKEIAYLQAAMDAQRKEKDKLYEHAKAVWDFFKCKNFEDYHTMYLESDGVLLLDAMQNFREIAIKEDGLDPLHFFGVPGLTYASFLKYHMEHSSHIPLECITDQHILDFVVRGLRGGMCVNNSAHAKANNPFMGADYNKSLPISAIAYLDANNLYGWAMMQCLPCEEYKWMKEILHNYFMKEILPNARDDGEVGYFVEVDIIPPTDPESLKRLDEYPLCPEVKVSPGATGPHEPKKLILDMLPKKNYVMHYRNLKFAIEKGYKVDKVHRVLQFKQAPFLKGYIQLQSTRRKEAKGNKFKGDYYKLKANSLYGKFIENKMNRIDYSIVKPNTYDKERRHPRFLDACSFQDGEMIGLLRMPKSSKVDTMNAVGVAILELSKLHMQKFHYDVMKEEYGEKAKLLYTDTDSLIYHVETDNLYAEMSSKLKLKNMIDMSGFAGKDRGGKSDRLKEYFSNHNCKIVGMFKEEGLGDVITSWHGVAPKVYVIEKVDTGHKCTAKGTGKTVTKHESIVSEYAAVASVGKSSKPVFNVNTGFRSKNHQVFTVRTEKLAFCWADNKRKWEEVDGQLVSRAWLPKDVK